MGRRVSFVDLADEGPMEVADVATLPPTRVPVAKCVRRPDNPRPADLKIDELASTIAEFGQMQPAAVASREAYLRHRPDHAEAIGDAEWVVLAGNRRHAACQKADVETFLVHVIDDKVAEVVEIGIIENIQREPLTPMREAQELQQLLDRYGTTRAVGAKIGKSHVYVSQRVSLLKLVPELQAVVDSGRLKIADARELARLEQEHQLVAYEAGPPYAAKPAKPHQIAETSRAEPVAASREVEPGNGVSNTPTPVGSDGADLAGGNAVSSEPALKAKAGTDDTVGNAVSNGHQPAVASETTAGLGNAVSNPAAPQGRAGLPQDPAVLVEQIHSEYTDEQQKQLLALLQR
ncbi:ParB/RepB/Spo0J family partition protein [Saccharopolyspora hattusasensis]|uniref:ParB/RepB/Spo0J family partition protein n=1 Tax=Saccharopolyspora hattusasensis TaxID=1128679 RepID=UPI003D99439F